MRLICRPGRVVCVFRLDPPKPLDEVAAVDEDCSGHAFASTERDQKKAPVSAVPRSV